MSLERGAALQELLVSPNSHRQKSPEHVGKGLEGGGQWWEEHQAGSAGSVIWAHSTETLRFMFPAARGGRQSLRSLGVGWRKQSPRWSLVSELEKPDLPGDKGIQKVMRLEHP